MNRFSLVSYDTNKNEEDFRVIDSSQEYLFSLSLQNIHEKDVLSIRVNDSVNNCRYQVKLMYKDFLKTTSINVTSLYWLKLLLSTALSNFNKQEEPNKAQDYSIKCEILVLKPEELKVLKNIDDLSQWNCDAIRENQKEFVLRKSMHHGEQRAKRTSVYSKLEKETSRFRRPSLQGRVENGHQEEEEAAGNHRGGLLLTLSVRSGKDNMKFEIGIQIPMLLNIEKNKSSGLRALLAKKRGKSKKRAAVGEELRNLAGGVEQAREFENFGDIKVRLAAMKERVVGMLGNNKGEEQQQEEQVIM